MKTRTRIAIGSIAAVALGAAVLAASGHAHRAKHGGPGGHAMLAGLDADGNGEITQAEIDSVRAARFARHDGNGDGALDFEEFAALYAEAMRARAERVFERMDEGGDAAISADEYDRPFADLVERMDRNGDGVLSADDRRHGGRHCRGDGESSKGDGGA